VSALDLFASGEVCKEAGWDFQCAMNAVRPLAADAYNSGRSNRHDSIQSIHCLHNTHDCPNTSFTEGFVPYVIDDEEYKTYYKLFGTITEDSRLLSPFMVVRRAETHHLFNMVTTNVPTPGLAWLTITCSLCRIYRFPSYARPVLFYDQIGNGRSSHFKDKPREFFTIDLFVNELVNILKHFKITKYDIAGHSWGGMLAAEFETRVQPEG